MVEFAVSVTLLVTVVVGIMDCCLAIYANHYVCYVAAEATRYAMVRGSTWGSVSCTSPTTESCAATSANVTSLVDSITPPGIDAVDYLTVATTWTGKTPTGANCSTANGTNSPGCVVQVQVTYNFSAMMPFVPNTTWPMSSTSTVVISR